MSLLFEPSTPQEARKMLLTAKDDITEYLDGIGIEHAKNLLELIEVRDYTRNGACYTLLEAPKPEIEIVTALKKTCKEIATTTKSTQNFTSHDYYITAQEVKELCNCSESKAYGIIKTLNDELKAKGYITIRGKVIRSYFEKRIGTGA